MPLTDTLLLIRPASFRMNEETSVNNYYQQEVPGVKDEDILRVARREFNQLAHALRSAGVELIVLEDNVESDTPDAVFPNNWISFHEDGSLVLYPMYAKNRRREIRWDIVELLTDLGFSRINDLSFHANYEEYLEGTGSVVLDRANGIAYCARSPRVNSQLFEAYCELMNFEPVLFSAYQNVAEKRELIYHTNVMMSIGDRVAIVCLECIDNEEERNLVKNRLLASGIEILEITEKQVAKFAGNMLHIKNTDGDKFFVMSDSAEGTLRTEQREVLLKYGEIIASDLTTIETHGGGSARCMLSEVFFPKLSEN